jgi:uncharacterized protein (DUF1697 family)
MIGREGLDRSVLLHLAKTAGCTHVTSYLATGNLTFQARREEAAFVATAIEAGLQDALGRSELVTLRSLGWLDEFVGRDRFAGYDPSEWELEVAFLRHDAAPVDVSLLDDPKRTEVKGAYRPCQPANRCVRPAPGKSRGPGPKARSRTEQTSVDPDGAA